MKFPAPVSEIVTSIEADDDLRLLDDVTITTLPDPQWLVKGLLPEKGVGFVIAPPSTGKTTFTTQMMVALATKRNFFGFQVAEQSSSIYVGLEDVPGFKTRLMTAKRAAHVALDKVIGVYTVPEFALNLVEPGDVLRLQRFISRKLEAYPPAYPLRLLVIDTWAAGTPGANENAAEDMTAAVVNCQRYLRNALGVTVLACHHTNAAGTRERGHTALHGAADFMIQMQPADDVVDIECKKLRNGPKFDAFKVKLVPYEDGVIFRAAGDVISTGELSPIQIKVLTVLEEAPVEGLTSAAWKSAVLGVSERSYYRAVGRLEELGRIQKVGSHYQARRAQ